MRRVKFALLSPLRHLLLIVMIGWATVAHGKINVHELRCEVCQRTVEEMVKDVDSIDPDKRVHVGEFMLDHNGDRPQKTVELRRSEIYLTELMEKVCSKMDDYVRAIMKDTANS
uniref:Protein canopy-1 n=1 Tax=Lygus hesperus TaxID=30085 RepID=A0A0A9YMR1_LYGHE